MNILELAKGKKMIIETDMKAMVELEVKNIEPVSHSEELEPSTPQNDWWPKTNVWTTYVVHFTNGAKKEYQSLHDIKFI